MGVIKWDTLYIIEFLDFPSRADITNVSHLGTSWKVYREKGCSKAIFFNFVIFFWVVSIYYWSKRLTCPYLNFWSTIYWHTEWLKIQDIWSPCIHSNWIAVDGESNVQIGTCEPFRTIMNSFDTKESQIWIFSNLNTLYLCNRYHYTPIVKHWWNQLLRKNWIMQ